MDDRNVVAVKKHNLEIIKRQSCHITGVVDVKEFEPQEIIIVLEDSILSLKGTDLHVDNLNIDQGELQLSGKVGSLQYTNKSSFKKKGEGLLKRMFQ